MTRSQLLFARIIGMLEAFREMHLTYDAPDVNDMTTDRIPSPPATEPTEQPESLQVSRKPPLSSNRRNLLLIVFFSLFVQSGELVVIGNKPSMGAIGLGQDRGWVVYWILSNKTYNTSSSGRYTYTGPNYL